MSTIAQNLASCGRRKEARTLRPPLPPSALQHNHRHVGESNIGAASGPTLERRERFRASLHLNKAGLVLGTCFI